MHKPYRMNIIQGFFIIQLASLLLIAAPIVPSKKRGICANKMTLEDARALAPGVTWWYNWHHTGPDLPDSPLEYIPMIWGRIPQALQIIEDRAKHQKSVTTVLVLNEPNLKGQATLTPEESALFWQECHRRLAEPFQIRLIGPHFALGSANHESIEAVDPITKKKTVYTFFVPFYEAFLHFLPITMHPDHIAIHSYGNIYELRWLISMIAEKFKKKIWLTEFAWWGAKDDKEITDYLIQAVDLLERNPYVERYAWFKEKINNPQRLSILGSQPGELTPLGKIYVHMPIHDPELDIPMEKLKEAEDFSLASDKVSVALTFDSDGFLDVTGLGRGEWVMYRLTLSPFQRILLRYQSLEETTLQIQIFSGSDLSKLSQPVQEITCTLPVASKPYQNYTITFPEILTIPQGILRITVQKGDLRLNQIQLQKE